ncbi:AI-2E family transporter [Paenibacillus larvae]|uniref:AI-2E family transporter n=1 Tax=Paenibacillus larvae TaxID=1464 RepID=UPI0018DE863E|nr:AI-2E family transporter [Paenibacillus larvae]
MPQSRFFRTCYGIIALLLIIFLVSKVSFLFNPLIKMFNILVVPFIIAGFFYYLLRPLVNYLTKKHVNRTASILLIYLILAILTVLFSMVGWPTLRTQMEHFVHSVPQMVEAFKEQIRQLQQNRVFSMFAQNESDISTKMSDYLDKGITAASNYVTGLVSVVTNFVMIVATVPIILYYMLKESDHIPDSIVAAIPQKYRRDGEQTLEEIDSALSGFIVGRVIITGLLGVMLYIGFLLIGLPYSLLLTVVSTVLNLIPYIGSILGAIPVLIVAFIHSPSMALWSMIVVIIAQQIESNLLSPHIYGKRLDIHPLTTIVLLLVAGDIGGILGVILAIPGYMVAKIIIVRAYHLFFAGKVEEIADQPDKK